MPYRLIHRGLMDNHGDFLGNQTKDVIVTLKNRASMGMGIHGKLSNMIQLIQ